MRTFRKFLKTPTPAQREAVDAVFLNNESGDTKVEIVKQLGISIESLRDRMRQAITKLEMHIRFAPFGVRDLN